MMYLHKDKALFEQAVAATSHNFKIVPAIVEKDYYVTIFLKQLSEHLPTMLFKGGTSLSKCYKVINRFSEDIDITLSQDAINKSQRRLVISEIKAVCEELGMTLLNESEIISGYDLNSYRIDYSPELPAVAINPILSVETTYIVKSYPTETQNASSMIYDYLASTGQDDFIKEYELSPFPVSVQTLERTLIDKIFAICDYYLEGNIPGHSRHIYDICRLVECVDLNDDFLSLFKKVRLDRLSSKGKCLSANNEYSITALLSEILQKDIYEKDYNDITCNIVFDNTSYDDAVVGLQKLIESGLLD